MLLSDKDAGWEINFLTLIRFDIYMNPIPNLHN